MADDRETRARIVDEAREQFFVQGFNKVRVDDIAANLGMSKKTLYKHFPSKENLFFCVIEDSVGRANEAVERVMADGELDFVEKLGNLAMIIVYELSRIGRPLIEDIERQFPKMRVLVQELRREQFEENFEKVMRQGTKEGVFRPDVDTRILGLVFSNAVFNILSPESLSTLPMTSTQAFGEIVDIIFGGILTEEGRRKVGAGMKDIAVSLPGWPGDPGGTLSKRKVERREAVTSRARE